MEASRAPATAPGIMVVDISSPSLRLVTWLSIYTLVAVQALMTIETRLLPMAYWMGMPIHSVSMGTIMMPPPTPSMEPSVPATSPVPASAHIFTSGMINLKG